MAMDAIDYSSNLARAKENYTEGLRKFKNTKNKETETLKETHELTQKKQYDTYDKAKQKLEKDFNVSLNQFREVGQKYNKERAKQQTKQIKELTERHDKDAYELKTERDSRIKLLKDSFSKSRENMEAQNNLNKVNTELNFKNKIIDINDKHKKEFGDYTFDSAKAQSDAITNMKMQKAELTRKHNDDILKLTDTSSKALMRKDMESDERLRSYKKAINSEFDNYKKTEIQAKDNLKKNAKHNLATMIEAYEGARERDHKNVEQKRERTLFDHRKEIAGLIDDQMKDKADLQRTIKIFSDKANSKKGSSQAVRQSLENDYQVRNRRREQLVRDLRFKFEQETDRAQDKFRDAYEDQKIVQKRNLDQRDQYFNDYVTESNLKNSLQKQSLVENFREREKIKDTDTKRAIETERYSHKRELDTYRKDFSNAFKRLESEKIQALRSQKATIDGKIRKINKEVKNRVADTTKDLMSQNSRKLHIQKGKYEDKLTNLETEMMVSEGSLSDKIDKLKGKFQLDMEFQRQISEDQRIQDIRELKRVAKLKDEQHDLALREQDRGHRRYIQKMNRQFLQQVNALKTGYEYKIRKMSTEFQRQARIKDSDHKAKDAQLKQQHEMEMTLRQAQFENEFEKTKAAHEQEIRRFREAQAAAASRIA